MSFFDNYKPDPSNVLTKELLPTGQYELIIESADVKTYKPTNGDHAESLELKFKVNAGPQMGRVLYHSIALDHPSEKKVLYGRKELDTLVSLTKATKLPSDLVGKKVSFRIIQKPKWNDAATNVNEIVISMPLKDGTAAPIPVAATPFG